MSSPVVMADGTLLTPSSICHGCVLQHSGAGYMKPSGSPHSGVVLVGEALGADEAQAGYPFVGAAGFALTRLLRFAGLRREHFGVANCVWCRPLHNDLKPFEPALDHCFPHLLDYINQQKAFFPQQTYWPAVTKPGAGNHVTVVHEPVQWSPKQLVLVALGETAFRTLTGWTGISDFRGYVFWSERTNCWVVPTFHPAYLLRGNLNQMLWARWDIEKAIELTKRPDFQLQVPMPLVDPPSWIVDDFIGRYSQRLASDPNTLLFFDIENPGGVMIRISFAFGSADNEVLSVGWSSHYLPAIRTLLASFGPKAAWHKHHDLSAIAAEGLQVNGVVHDSMDMWHCLHSDLDKALVNVSTRYLPWIKPWKHLFKTDIGFYSAMDSLSGWVNHHGIAAELKTENLDQVYVDHMLTIDQITGQMSKVGLQVDQPRQASLRSELRAQLATIEAAMQLVVPTELRPLNPPDGYKKPPKFLNAELLGEAGGVNSTQSSPHPGPIDSQQATSDPSLEYLLFVNQPVKVCSQCKMVNPLASHFKGTKSNPAPCPTGTKVNGIADQWRWARREPFVPSTQQLLRYAAHRKHTVYKNHLTGSYTMDDEAIGRMLKKYPADPLYPLVLEHRAVQKELTTYIEVPTDDLGVVHCHFNHKPWTDRFGCEDPNMQNWPRDGAARSLFVARPGHVFWKRDYSAIEAVLVGYEAMDPTYIRMAKLGIHDYVLGNYLGMAGKLASNLVPQASWPDQDLKDCFKLLKATFTIEREMCKRIVHLSNYLGTPEKIYSLYPQAFGGSLGKARDLQAFYFDLFPSIPKWHLAECLKIETSFWTRNAFGYRYFFFAPFDYDRAPDGTYERKWGPDAKRIVASKPQGGAAGIIKQAMRWLAADPLVGPTLRLTIHDELFGECRLEDLDEVQAMAQHYMELPLPQYPLPAEWNLGPYLSIGTEGSSGFRWSDMSTKGVSQAELYELAAIL